MSSKVRSRSEKHKSSRSKSKPSSASEQSLDECAELNLQNIQLDDDIRKSLEDFPEVLSFIEKLQRIIQKQVKKIIKWKRKAKQILENTGKNVSTQTHFDENIQESLNEIESIEIKGEKSFADDIREAAEQATQSTGFVYEETSGLYYDYNSGYYYNAEYGLYYDGTSGTYLKYNAETQNYDFHSQVDTTEINLSQPMDKEQKPKRKSKNKQKSKESKRRRPALSMDDLEDGECSNDSASSNADSVISESSDLSKQWPPCMRVIVESTEIPKIKSGSLFIITCDGGTIGREGDHSICLPDINVSKHHLKISYDSEKYLLVDLGSRNGTLLNGQRMSSSKQESEPTQILHGSRIQLGSTILLCHIHEGTQTCGHCEPGLLLGEEKYPLHGAIKKTSNEQFKSELKRLRKLHGLLGSEASCKLGDGYTDRAQKRREEFGSQNPYEKTEAASVEASIPSQNKGFKLLAKMGWKEGESLGKEGTGVKEPINVVSNLGTTGIGAVSQVRIAEMPKKNIWKKTQERFEKLPETTAIIDDADSD
ncbi:unnamed protein product [Ceutorhynchus assimilis]|uniref:Angiogenic factor with G patch and FHA domains 1 n=1 Tax=Ceutorhynchus assimilis TaxID=467358 RepID=A0A9N9MQ31_9CUCU|nr:unnamed protein product [Ceutorhynchus assimilis]